MTPYTNRELSWLEFNQRVLEQSKREDLPLLERLRFLSISSSNLDEFYQVRIGGLTEKLRRGDFDTDPAGMTITSQLYQSKERSERMIEDQYIVWNETLQPALEKNNIKLVRPSLLSGKNLQDLYDHTVSHIVPILTPIALQYEHSNLVLPALQMCIICKLESQAAPARHAIIPIPTNLPRFIPVRDALGNARYILLEEAISYHIKELFPHEKVTECAIFRVTKNSDLELEDLETQDLAGEMKAVLSRRRLGDPVRIETPHTTSKDLREIITTQTGADYSQVISVKGPLALADFAEICEIPGNESLKFTPWHPHESNAFEESDSLFDTLDQKNVILYHPYESFDPVVRLIEEASKDTNTLAIKQVLYRTASKSSIIQALKNAALNGKQVTVVIELKARFDEEHNLLKAEELQKAGVQVIYGVKGYKTHAKATLIVRKTLRGITRYVHLGTGNYNETTASLYTDISYLTSDSAIASDTSLFFNMLTGHSKMTQFQTLSPAPTHMKRTLLELISKEAEIAKAGQKARIIAKMNSLEDLDIISALYSASQSGVEILLNIRGVCCLQPGIDNVSSNIHVISIIDRYLEHSRAFYFEQGGAQKCYIASADWMKRNLDKRLELMIAVEDENEKSKILNYLEAGFRDTINSYELQPDGTSTRIVIEGVADFQYQKYLYEMATEGYTQYSSSTTETFTPVRYKVN